MNVAISGSRTFTDRRFVEKVVARLLERGDFIIIGDAASGVDLFAWDYLRTYAPPDRWWREIADWHELGKVAGHIRNGHMIENAEQLVTIFADGLRSAGTSDCLNQAARKGIPIYVYHQGHWTFEGPAWPTTAPV